MKGPDRPQIMQTADPFTTSAAPATSGERSSGRVRNQVQPCED